MEREMNRVQQLRARTGLSQGKFAKKFGMSVKTVQAWEINQTKPPVYVLDMIEKILDYESLLGGEVREKA